MNKYNSQLPKFKIATPMQRVKPPKNMNVTDLAFQVPMQTGGVISRPIAFEHTIYTDEELVSSFLLKSQNTVLSKTNRSELIDDLNDYVLKLAIALYNRQGNEGLASYSEGGESESYQSEDEILSGISNYRLSAMARRLKDEKKKSQEVSN